MEKQEDIQKKEQKEEKEQKEQKEQNSDKQLDELRQQMDRIKMISELSIEQQQVLMNLFKTNDANKLSHELNKKRAFWDSQPVPKMEEYLLQTHKQLDDSKVKEGPIEIKKTDEIRKESYNIPSSFEWINVDLTDKESLQKVYSLLYENYVEDDDNMFRFDYSTDFLKWALLVPGYFKDWIVGVQVKTNKKLVGFITAIPVCLMIQGKKVRMAEVNFLCVHKKMRAHRLAPVLIKEITRRVNLRDMWQAIYTAGVVIPSPYGMAQYWHRSINPKKLIECKFSSLGKNQTMSRVIKLYKLPDQTSVDGFRQMKSKDVGQVSKLLNNYLEQFQVHVRFTEEEIKHFLAPRDEVIYSYVVEQDKKITDFVSFYSLPSSVLNNPKYTHIKAAYSYYHVATSLTFKQLLGEAMVMAKKEGFDVFNALDIMHNKEFISELTFSPGDGFLHYYFYNYKMANILKAQEIGVVLV